MLPEGCSWIGCIPSWLLVRTVPDTKEGPERIGPEGDGAFRNMELVVAIVGGAGMGWGDKTGGPGVVEQRRFWFDGD